MQNQLWAFAAAAAMAAPLSAQTATTTFDTVAGVPAIDKTTQTEDVRFKSRDNRMTVPVQFSQGGPYQFLVDTGADRTAISHDLVEKLKLQTEGGTQLHSLAGVSNVETARINDVRLTRRPERSVDAAVLNGANMGADGIVGVDLLRSQRVQFDFEKQTMSIVPATTPEFVRGPDVIVIEARRKNGRLIVTDAVANGQPLTVVVDTGSQVSIGNRARRAKLLRNNLVDVAHQVELESVTGEKIMGEYMIVRKLEIGGINLTNLAIVFADAHTFKQLKLNDRPSLLLGMNAIRAFKRVSIDFANKKFRVMLPEESSLDIRFAAAGQP
jgi:predicted aspartyl protease